MCLHSLSFLPTNEDKENSWAIALLSLAAVTMGALPVLNRPSSSSLVPISHIHRSQLGWVLPSRREGCRMIAPALQETRVWKYELSGWLQAEQSLEIEAASKQAPQAWPRA